MKLTTWPWNMITAIVSVGLIGGAVYKWGNIESPLIGFLGTLITISALIFTILQQFEIRSRIDQMRANHFNLHCQGCISLIDKILLSNMSNIDTIDFMLNIVDDYLEECELSCIQDTKFKISKLIQLLSGRRAEVRICRQQNRTVNNVTMGDELTTIKKQLRKLMSPNFVN